ncbi:MAG: hypothetical protein MUC87_13945 [Bacteroidia bacterium]|jgi:hypothetical protein|nr:hypothetical protein [Bacteroidia bacterium]
MTSISKVFAIAALLFGSATVLQAQTNRLKTGVLHIDSNLPEFRSEQMGSMVRLEAQKLDTFNVLDRYEMQTLLQNANLKADNCFGRLCVVEAGKALDAQKMITGSIERLGDQIVYTLQFIDVPTESVERTRVMEFVYDPREVQTMTAVMLRAMFNRQVEEIVLQQLQKPGAYEMRSRSPRTETLRLDGPRVGATLFTGETARILGLPKAQGGYNAVPYMFQFGYQFERQYLTAGNFQALFEFVPMITGLDQGLFIPSFTLMNGLRSSKRGWEFAFGPTLNLVTVNDGFYDQNGSWITKDQWNAEPANQQLPQPAFITRMDSRGDVTLHSSFVFAVGKTFRSGNVNVPVNGFAIPSRDGWRFGLSFGYNARIKS